MASFRVPAFFLFILVLAILMLSHPVNCNEDEDKLLQGINNYRTARNLPVLKEHDNAHCLADEVAEQLEDKPCTSTNGTNVVPGADTQLSSYPDLLKKCKIDINTTRDGAILRACVPGLTSSLVLSNFTQSQYSKYLNDSKYSGVGIGSEDDWIVVVLSTNTPSGNFANTAACLVSQDDAGMCINKYRRALDLTLLEENDNAQCLADELAEQLEDIPCTSTTINGANTVLSIDTQFTKYPDLLNKCEIDINTTRDGVILRACGTGLVSSLVGSNLAESDEYSKYLKDFKYSGVGIGSEDDWIVVVLSTNTPAGNFAKAAFLRTNATAAGSSANAAAASNLVSKVGLFGHYLFLLLGLFLVLPLF